MGAVTDRSEGALAELHRRYGRAMASTADRMGLASDAEDVVQDVFLRLWQHPDRFDATRGSLRSFLLLQVRGRTIDTWRRDAARRTREALEPFDQRPSSPPADAEVLAQLHTELVLRLLDCLTPAERDAITLAFYGGHSYTEVAALLGEPTGTIKGRIRSGLRHLRAVSQDQAATFDLDGP